MAFGRFTTGAAAAGFYALFAFEILYMISPFALQFYAVYGPFLNAFHGSPWTAWLTGFFLPHAAASSSAWLAGLQHLAEPLFALGVALFLVCFAQVYGAKLLRRGAVRGGLYRFARHPQYAALSVAGLGLLIRWPRFFVALSYAGMLVVYDTLSRIEERECLARFGDSYREYASKAGRFVPFVGRGLSTAPTPRRTFATGVAAMAVVLLAAFGLREHTLDSLHAVWRDGQVVIAPAPLDRQRIERAYGLAAAAAPPPSGSRVLAYVVPESWFLADLPVDALEPQQWREVGGHRTPESFDPDQLKVLLAVPRSHRPAAKGKDIVRTAWGLRPVAVVHVDLRTGRARAVPAPAHVVWGDIPTPLF